MHYLKTVAPYNKDFCSQYKKISSRLTFEAVKQMLMYSFIGSAESIKKKMTDFIATTQIDEVMATSHIYDHHAKLHSYSIFAEVLKTISV